MMGLEPRRLIGGQGKGCRVCFAETERGEGAQHIPDLFDGVEVVPLVTSCRIEPGAYLVLGIQRPEIAAHLIGFGKRASRHHRHHAQDLFVEDDDAVGLSEHGTQIVVEVSGRGPPLT